MFSPCTSDERYPKLDQLQQNQTITKLFCFYSHHQLLLSNNTGRRFFFIFDIKITRHIFKTTPYFVSFITTEVSNSGKQLDQILEIYIVILNIICLCRYIDILVPPIEPQVLRRGRSLRGTSAEEDGEMLIDKYTCCPPPTFFFIISFIEFGCFIADELTEENSSLTGTGVTSKILIFDPTKKSEIWRYLTYMLVHIG